MFTGIIETTGEVIRARHTGGNLDLEIRSAVSATLKPGQSVSHNGVCLTVTEIQAGCHRVTLVDESLKRTSFLKLKEGSLVNLERAMPANGRLDGHIVQGHVDTVARCTKKMVKDGSTLFYFSHPHGNDFITVQKGSVCVDGVSLTVVDATPDSFSVALIPYTLEHTSFSRLNEGDEVNLEFDIIGKYVRRLAQN